MAPFFTGLAKNLGGFGFGRSAAEGTRPPVLLTFTVTGGSGNSPATFTSYPLSGVGGKTVATILTPVNQVFKIYVGQRATDGTAAPGYYNGGPAAANAGGGASAVTFGPSPVCTAETMIMGVGGGGGMGGPSSDAYGSGGPGGGGTSSGTSGSQQMNGPTLGGPTGAGAGGTGNTFPGANGTSGIISQSARGGGGGGGFTGGSGGNGFLYGAQRWIAGGGGGGGGYINTGSNFPNVLEAVTVTLSSSGTGDTNNTDGSVVVVGPAGTTTYPSSPGSYTVPAASL